MYVVKRSFRNLGNNVAPGSIVEPGAIKRFKSLLSDGHIVEVTEHDFDKWSEYFKEKFNVSLPKQSKGVATPKATDVKETQPAKATTKTVVKTVTKAAVK